MFVRIWLSYEDKSKAVPDMVNTTKTDPVNTACIFIKFISTLEENCFSWIKIPIEKFSKMIVQELGESDENLNSIIPTPLLATETEFAKKLENDFLKNTFIQLTMKIAIIHYNNKQSKEENKNLRNIIKNKDLENTTTATKEGLNSTNILESMETLENFLQERDKVLEQKLLSKFIQDQKQKI